LPGFVHGRVDPLPPAWALVLPDPAVVPPLTVPAFPAPAPVLAPPGVAVADGVAVDVALGEAPGVAVAEEVGAGVAIVVSTGEGIGEGEAVLEG
jgi:hypothetical protein